MKKWVPQERNPAERGAYSFDFRTSAEERQLDSWPRRSLWQRLAAFFKSLWGRSN